MFKGEIENRLRSRSDYFSRLGIVQETTKEQLPNKAERRQSSDQTQHEMHETEVNVVCRKSSSRDCGKEARNKIDTMRNELFLAFITERTKNRQEKDRAFLSEVKGFPLLIFFQNFFSQQFQTDFILSFSLLLRFLFPFQFLIVTLHSPFQTSFIG